MIIRAPIVVTMDGAPIVNGAIVVREGEILDVGSWREVSARNAGEVLDLEGRALLPGLINAHCHLDYTDLRGAMAKPISFTDWIREINARKASWGADDYVRSIRNGFAEAARFGTTTVVNFEAFPDLIRQVLPAPIRTWWLAEMIDVRSPVAADETFAKMCASIGEDPLSFAGLAPHALFTASRALLIEAAALCKKHDAVFSTHLAESMDEKRMFRDADGPLYHFMKGIGREMDDCGRLTPLGLISTYEMSERWILAHLNEVTPDDFSRLESCPRFSVVHCPRSHAFFGHSQFPLRELRGLGFNRCLGTDSLASNDDLSLFAEMRQLAKVQPGLSKHELLEMTTVNGARAIGRCDKLGQVRIGYRADLIGIPFTGNMNEIYDEIVAFDEAVPWLMIDGRMESPRLTDSRF